MPEPFHLTAGQLIGLDLFRGMTEGDAAALAGQAVYQRLDVGEYFFMQGDTPDRLWVLCEGAVRLSQLQEDGQQVVLRVIRPVNLFGAVALAQAGAYPVSAQAIEPACAAWWKARDLMEMVGRSPQLAMNAMRFMAQRAQEFQDRYREMATERVERRVARTLLRLAAQTGKKTPEGVLIDFPLSRQDLAEMTGTTLYTVSRILSQWQTQGLISSGRERVVVVYPHGLVRIAEDLPPR